jgi:hypothetical protein
MQNIKVKSNSGSTDYMVWGLLALIAYLVYENVAVNASTATNVNTQTTGTAPYTSYVSNTTPCN